ncbi:MAG: diaminopimelate epimerase [Hyphomicrobiaceae bacterium]
MSSSGTPYAKMNGIGNEILVVDLRAGNGAMTGEAARALAARPATKFDQLMALMPPRTPGTASFVRIYNADGSEAGACGNGTRCVGDYLTRETGGSDLLVETVAGVLSVVKAGEHLFSVDMGRPRLKWDEIPLAEPFHDTRMVELQIGPIDNPVLHSPSVANMGNPHCVFWVDDVEAHDLGRIGPFLENHPLFPEQANISLAEVTGENALKLRTWERGVGLTKACGSAACAAAVSAARKGLTGRTVSVALPGGTLVIDWRADDHVVMTGPCAFEHEGTLDLGALV